MNDNEDTVDCILRIQAQSQWLFQGQEYIQQRESDDKLLKLLKLLYCEPDLLLAFPKVGS
jgi:hypothetical protein